MNSPELLEIGAGSGCCCPCCKEIPITLIPLTVPTKFVYF